VTDELTDTAEKKATKLGTPDADLDDYERGATLTIGELRAMPDGTVVWVRHFEHADPSGSWVDHPSRITWTGNGDLMLDDVGMDFDPGDLPDDDRCFDEGFGEVEMCLSHADKIEALKWVPVTALIRKSIRPRCGDIPRSWNRATSVNGISVFKNQQKVSIWLMAGDCWISATPKKGRSFDDVARLLVRRR